MKEITTKSGAKFTITEKYAGKQRFSECVKALIDYYIDTNMEYNKIMLQDSISNVKIDNKDTHKRI